MSQVSELQYWVSRLLKCKTLTDYRDVLIRFAEHSWTLTERSIISAIYTPPVVKMLGGDDDKWRWLEELEGYCWRVN